MIETVDSRYRVVDIVGRGAQATTYLAEDLLNKGKKVLLKVYPGSSFQLEAAWEFRQLIGLDHPSVVRILGTGSLVENEAPSTFIAEEWVSGKPADLFAAQLRDPAGSEKSFWRWFADFFLQAAWTLHYIHSRGILHRDIKPGHILVSGDAAGWRMCYIDFGLAGAAGRDMSSLCGTPGYIAPECIKGHYSALSDLYALGATAYVVAGGSLGAGLDRVEVTAPLSGLLVRIADEALEQVFRGEGAAFLDIARKLVHPDPFERFPSAKALAEHLMRTAGGSIDGAVPAHRVSRPAFVGRRDVIRRVVEAAERRLAGSPGPVTFLFKGPRGTGKSATIEEIKKAIILRSVSKGASPPVIIEGASALAGESTEAAPWPPGDAAVYESAIMRRANAILESRSGGSGLIFILDNPRAEAAALAGLSGSLAFRGTAPRRVVLIVEWDSDVDGPSMETLAAARGVEVEALGPLTADETGELLRSALGDAADPTLIDRISRRSGGNPLFAVELAHLAAARGFRLGDGDVPETAADIIASDLEALPSEARRLVEAVVAAGNGLDAGVAAEVLGCPGSDMMHLAAALSGKGWLETGGRLRLHPLVADALAGRLDAGVERDLHAALAGALERRGAPPDALEVAFHLFMGGDDAARESFLTAVGALERRSDYGAGLELLDRALARRPAALGAEGLLMTARFLRSTGNYARALETLRRIDEREQGPAMADMRCFEEAATLRLSGESAEASALLQDLLGRPGLEPGLRARAAALLGRILVDEGRHDKALDAAERALAGKPDETQELLLLEPYALALMAAGRGEEAGRSIARGLEIARRAGPAGMVARYAGLMGLASQRAGDLGEAEARYREAAESARRSGDVHAFSVFNLNLGSVHMEQGKWSLALEKYHEAARALESIGGWRELAGVLLNWANLRIRMGDDEGALALVQRCAAVSRHFDLRGYPPLLGMLEGDIAMMRQRYGDAVRAYEASQDKFAGEKNETYRVLAALLRAEAMVFAGRVEESGRILAGLERHPALGETPWLGDRHRFVSGFLEAQWGGDAAAGVRLVASALEGFAARGEKDMMLCAETVLAKLHAAGGNRGEARRHVEAAVGIADAVRREALRLGYDPSRTNPYMKLLRKAVDMKDPSFGPFSKEDAVFSEPVEGRWARLAQINKRINSELRLSPLLELILDTMIDITRAARGYIILRDAEGNLRIRCARNIDSRRLQAEASSFSRSIVARVMESASPVITVDAASDEHLRSSESVVEMNLKSVMAVPLMAKGRVLGAIYVDNPYASNMFGQDDVALMMTFADQAGIALENARLLAENTKRERKIERLNRRLEKLLGEQKVELDAMRETLEHSLSREPGLGRRYPEIVGESKAIQRVFHLLDRIIETDLPAVIVGASGTGKELVARAIHFNSRRRASPFVTENCGAIPDTLLESVLFGHVKGAFTGADRSRPGLLEMASRGTLLLDEIDSMSLSMQTKLLRALQDGVIRPLGGETERKVDVRVIAATGTRLEKLVREGRFREDLFYRINVICVELPLLRERAEDIPLLVKYFIEKHGGGRTIEISRGAMKKLMDHDWPGNVRQLENEIMRSIVLSEGRIMESMVLQQGGVEAEAPAGVGGNLDLRENVEKLESALIGAALQRTGGNQSAAARMLGVSRFGLIKKMARYGLAKT